MEKKVIVYSDTDMLQDVDKQFGRDAKENIWQHYGKRETWWAKQMKQKLMLGI